MDRVGGWEQAGADSSKVFRLCTVQVSKGDFLCSRQGSPGTGAGTKARTQGRCYCCYTACF